MADVLVKRKPFALRADWVDQMLELVKKEKKQSAQSAFQLAAENEKVNLRLQRLLDTFLDGLIDRDVFTLRNPNVGKPRLHMR